jgi:hypothetical protein
MLYAVLLFGSSEKLSSEFEVRRSEMKYSVPTNITVGNAAPYDRRAMEMSFHRRSLKHVN